MDFIKRIGIGLIVGTFGLAGLSACAGDKEQVEEDQEVAEQQQKDEGVMGEADQLAQQTEEKSKDVAKGVSEGAERAEKNIEEFIGGGPAQSDTQRILEEVEREMANYKNAMGKADKRTGQKIDAATRMRFQQLEERAKLLRKHLNEMQQQKDMGVVAIDETLEGEAEDLEDDWDDVEDDLDVVFPDIENM